MKNFIPNHIIRTAKSQKGSLTIDYIFAFTLIFSFTLIMFSFALTLTAVEMTQYLTYTSARAYFAAHHTQDKQSEQASKKWDQLISEPGYSFINKNSWFVLDDRWIGNVSESPIEELKQYLPSGGDPNRFEGVVVGFVAKILSMSSPLFGATDPDGDGSGNTFLTRIGSYLGREPTTQDCAHFISDRWKAIRTLNVEGGGSSYSTGTDENKYFPIMDNGC